MKVFDKEYDCYFPSFYNIYINSSKSSLGEIIGSDKEPELFHEYLHFIQDITTTFGLINTSCIMNKIKDMYEYIGNLQKTGIKDIHLPITTVSHSATSINILLFKYYLQSTETVELEGDELAYEPDKVEDMVTLPNGNIVFVSHYEVTTNTMNKYQFGTHAIMEGICHCLQKEVYGITEPCLQAPYNLSKLIWDYMLPEEKDNIKAFIDLSEVSLMHLMSAEVFIETIKKIQDKQLQIDDHFYNEICSMWKTQDEVDIYTNFEESYITMWKDVKGTLKAKLYDTFNNWLESELRIGYDWRLKKEPIFSSFIEMKTLTADKRSDWLLNMFIENGFPPILNSDGIVFCHQKNDFLSYVSFLSTIIMASAYDAVSKQIFEGCPLKDNCIEENQKLKPEQQHEVNEICDTAPWNQDLNKCIFAGVWNTWGLKKFNCTR